MGGSEEGGLSCSAWPRLAHPQPCEGFHRGADRGRCGATASRRGPGDGGTGGRGRLPTAAAPGRPSGAGRAGPPSPCSRGKAGSCRRAPVSPAGHNHHPPRRRQREPGLSEPGADRAPVSAAEEPPGVSGSPPPGTPPREPRPGKGAARPGARSTGRGRARRGGRDEAASGGRSRDRRPFPPPGPRAAARAAPAGSPARLPPATRATGEARRSPLTRCGPAPEAPASVGRASAPAQAGRKQRQHMWRKWRHGERRAARRARMEDSAPETQQLRSLRDFLLVYNRMTELCFQRCVADLNYRALTRDEEACLDCCAGKLVRSNHRLMAAYVQLMPSLVQRRIADYEAAGRDPAALPGPDAS
ncbi:mitochondrial import inner membrane translocase subunit Tim10 B [Crotalus adamanteus]|uniref:Mitochondrial import inner membrane translocase subunit Tim10 B n=1 Tax=Crotalus adamanteus TaxID=8729 RepID=A0AAW1BKN2_CROAD